MTVRHPSYSPPAPFDYASPAGPAAFRIWHGIESEDPPYERHNHDVLLATAVGMLRNRQKRFPDMVSTGDMTAEAAHAEIATVAAIVADWRWIITGEGEPAHISTLTARRALLDQSIQTIATMARERGGFSTALEEQCHIIIAMRWHLEPERETHILARFNHESQRRAQPPEQARAA